MSEVNPTEYIVIDDDPVNNLICSKIIKLAVSDAQVETFTNPETGLQYLQTARNAGNMRNMVIFLDINMPILTGWEVLDLFDKLPATTKKHIIIYILSSSVDLQDRERASNNPYVEDYIVKPLTKYKIQELLGKK